MPGPAVTPKPRTDSLSARPPSLLSRVVPMLSQGNDLFTEQLARTAVTIDRAFAVVLTLEWLAGIVLALVVSPLTWAGAESAVHVHVWAALLLGGTIALPPAFLVWIRPGTVLGRHLIAAAQMLMAALYIHLTGGRIETHFLIFGSLAFLATYRDPNVLITASIVVVVDHLLRGWFFPRSVYGVDTPTVWRSLEHAWWVVFEDLFLIYMILYGNRVQNAVARDRLGEMGQYVLKERLGGGGMGEVHLAEHRLLKRPCAIKLIRPDLAHDAQVLGRFRREVQTTAQLRHPNTVAIFDFGNLEDGTFFYVMEYLPGLSLQQLVDRHGPLPPARVVYLLRQVCGALQEAHAAGLVHRDVKPDNVLVCRLGGQHDVAKLFDFGLVQTVAVGDVDSRLTQAGSVLGTPTFMSPEQVTGEEIDHRSDLFSLGAVAFFLLTGKAPFEGKNPLAVMYARLKDPVPAPSLHRPDLPRDLEDIVVRCMDREPGGRFPHAKDLAAALAACNCGAEWNDERARIWWETTPNGSRQSSSSDLATAIFTPATPTDPPPS
jgi:serine/threonine protein kinase